MVKPSIAECRRGRPGSDRLARKRLILYRLEAARFRVRRRYPSQPFANGQFCPSLAGCPQAATDRPPSESASSCPTSKSAMTAQPPPGACRTFFFLLSTSYSSSRPPPTRRSRTDCPRLLSPPPNLRSSSSCLSQHCRNSTRYRSSRLAYRRGCSYMECEEMRRKEEVMQRTRVSLPNRMRKGPWGGNVHRNSHPHSMCIYTRSTEWTRLKWGGSQSGVSLMLPYFI